MSNAPRNTGRSSNSGKSEPPGQKQYHRPFRQISEDDRVRILEIIRAWPLPTITWEALAKALESRLGHLWTRQSLFQHQVIRDAFQAHNLENMVTENQFREDLWFRLNVFPIIVPPLRQRKEDVPALTRHFVELKCRDLGIANPPAIAPGALDRLVNYGWPGNVRELENLVERELILHRGGLLKFESLKFIQSATGQVPLTEQADDNGPLNLDVAMSRHILRVLKMTKGKIHGPGGAAEVLGLNPNTLRGRMKKLRIQFGRNH